MCVEGESFGNHVVFYQNSDPSSLKVTVFSDQEESGSLFWREMLISLTRVHATHEETYSVRKLSPSISDPLTLKRRNQGIVMKHLDLVGGIIPCLSHALCDSGKGAFRRREVVDLG